VRRDQLHATLYVSEGACGEVRDVEVLTAFLRPVEDGLRRASCFDRHVSRRRDRLDALEPTSVAVESVAVVLPIEASLAALAGLEAGLCPCDNSTNSPRRTSLRSHFRAEAPGRRRARHRKERKAQRKQ